MVRAGSHGEQRSIKVSHFTMLVSNVSSLGSLKDSKYFQCTTEQYLTNFHSKNNIYLYLLSIVCRAMS